MPDLDDRRPEAVESHDWPKPDLQQRFEQLPPDHPSSPYMADGTRKPPPRSLRDLELPLPGDEDEAPETDTPQRDYWTEVPRFQRMWTEHGRERPEGPPERSALLSREQYAQAREVIGDMQGVEPSITDHIQGAERQNAYDGQLAGLEHRLKGEDRLLEKTAEILKREPGRQPGEVVREIPDAIRYTFCLRAEVYADGYRDIRQRLEAFGYEMTYSKNYWNNIEYKGINTRWLTSQGQPFEVQFHTPESYHAKQEVTHGAYERIRNPLTSRAERAELRSFQREVSSWIPVPDSATDIPDYKKEGR